VAGGGSSVDGGTGSSAAGGSSGAGGGEDGSSTTGGSSDAGGAGSLAVGGEGASVLVVGVSLGPDGDGVEDAACDGGAPSEVEEDSPPREGAAASSSVEEGAEPDEATLLDGLTSIPSDLPDSQGIAELAVVRSSRTLCSTVFSPSSVPSSASTWSSTCSITSPATRPIASSGLAIGLSESGASHESSETATTAAAITPAPANA
jgi:hypothetical protein